MHTIYNVQMEGIQFNSAFYHNQCDCPLHILCFHTWRNKSNKGTRQALELLPSNHSANTELCYCLALLFSYNLSGECSKSNLYLVKKKKKTLFAICKTISCDKLERIGNSTKNISTEPVQSRVNQEEEYLQRLEPMNVIPAQITASK